MAAAKAKGKRFGRPGFGWKRVSDSEFVQDEAQQAVLAEIRSLAASGTPLNTIAGLLNERGTLTANGKKWYASSVRVVLGHSVALAGAK